MTNDRRSQAHAVKTALKNADIPIKNVRWGTGTAYGWLSLTLAPETPFAVQQQARVIAVRVLGRKPDVVDCNHERTHNECVSVQNAPSEA